VPSKHDAYVAQGNALAEGRSVKRDGLGAALVQVLSPAPTKIVLRGGLSGILTGILLGLALR
jgi:hypothetical protein